MNEDQVYLGYILDCIDKIKEYSQGGKLEFFANSMISDAIIRRLQTLAESTQQLSEELKANIPDVDWRNISGFRNILVHDYLGGIDLNTVWDVVENYLDNLREQILRHLESVNT
ncbi:HepT-like ribonuclease domain-containing protein [Microcystis aeruginosa]|jgi:uncharacterized protein with HEPN domain|uniref:HepT-like ribonuclease domain-containing protein n=1 Tax=Microcystis aeruginosa TaxID=1126 RepID=UPI002931D020|nr:HepT-like ribonuclease domain-containing protein [Microcystis aeruginosa]WOB70094.1 DUF86 domain-containing protein [Microcystis aeruginosa LE3]